MMQSDASEEISEPEEETKTRLRFGRETFLVLDGEPSPQDTEPVARGNMAMKDTGVNCDSSKNFKKHPGLYYFFIRALFTL